MSLQCHRASRNVPVSFPDDQRAHPPCACSSLCPSRCRRRMPRLRSVHPRAKVNGSGWNRHREGQHSGGGPVQSPLALRSAQDRRRKSGPRVCHSRARSMRRNVYPCVLVERRHARGMIMTSANPSTLGHVARALLASENRRRVCEECGGKDRPGPPLRPSPPPLRVGPMDRQCAPPRPPDRGTAPPPSAPGWPRNCRNRSRLLCTRTRSAAKPPRASPAGGTAKHKEGRGKKRGATGNTIRRKRAQDN
jgi:hypothetical protein